MAETRKFGSFEEMRQAIEGDKPVANCRTCGKPLPADSRHETCSDCFQKQRAAQSNSGGQNSSRQHPQGARNQGSQGRNVLRPYSEYIDSLEQGYFDVDGYLREDMITTWPKQLAEAFKNIELTTGQMRRFFAHARRVRQRMSYGESFQAVRPAILEMSPLAADAVGRAESANKNYEMFRDFIDRNVALASQDRKQFEEGFLLHFQYVVAYFKYFNPRG